MQLRKTVIKPRGGLVGCCGGRGNPKSQSHPSLQAALLKKITTISLMENN
jgi:hypothetical protein